MNLFDQTPLAEREAATALAAERQLFEANWRQRHGNTLYCESEWRGWQAAREVKPTGFLHTLCPEIVLESSPCGEWIDLLDDLIDAVVEDVLLTASATANGNSRDPSGHAQELRDRLAAYIGEAQRVPVRLAGLRKAWEFYKLAKAEPDHGTGHVKDARDWLESALRDLLDGGAQ